MKGPRKLKKTTNQKLLNLNRVEKDEENSNNNAIIQFGTKINVCELNLNDV